MAQRAENIGHARLVPPTTPMLGAESPGLVRTTSAPVSGSARNPMSGTRRAFPARLLWNDGFDQTPLVPPPAPKIKPSCRGGKMGGFGNTLAIRVSLFPQPVCSLMV